MNVHPHSVFTDLCELTGREEAILKRNAYNDTYSDIECIARRPYLTTAQITDGSH